MIGLCLLVAGRAQERIERVEQPPAAREPSAYEARALDQAIEVLRQIGGRSNDESVRHDALYASIIMAQKHDLKRILCQCGGMRGDAATSGDAIVRPAEPSPSWTRFTQDPGDWVVVSVRHKHPDNLSSITALAGLLLHEAVHCVQECDRPTRPGFLTAAMRAVDEKKGAVMEIPAYSLQLKFFCDLADNGYYLKLLADVYGPLSPGEFVEMPQTLRMFKAAAADNVEYEKETRDC